MKKCEEKKDFPSLYDCFELGQRVERSLKNKNGEIKVYKGIILAIDNEGMEIYWDTKDGRYLSEETDFGFCHCKIQEIYKGSSKYSPIKKDRIY